MSADKKAIDVLTAALPDHCACGHPRCSVNRRRAEAVKALTALTELIDASRESLRLDVTSEQAFDNRYRLRNAITGVGG